MNNDANKELNIQIDRLVFEGFTFTSYQQERLKESIESALIEIFTVKGIPKVNKSTYAMRVSDTVHLNGNPPDQARLGKQIATSIYNGLKSLE